MAYVIKRYLSKSGGNAIGMRIGRFNSFSSHNCQQLKQIAYHAAIQNQNRELKRASALVLLDTIDEFRSRKTLSIYCEWDYTQSFRLISIPRAKAEGAYVWDWCTVYAKRVADKIFKNCYSYTDVRKNHSLGIISTTFAEDRFRALITKIINKSKKIASFPGSSRFPGGRTNDLINRTTNICAERWRTGPASFQGL